VTDHRVRPFSIVAGRTRARARDLPLETMVVVSPGAPAPRFEAGRVHALCGEPIAIGELAARAGIVLGVARVLVGDLVASGALEVCGAGAPVDTALLGRVLAGLEAL
jgi:hypothetical protein